MNDDLKSFKGQIIKYTIVVTLIIEACSIPVLGFNVGFLCGLLVGAVVAIASFLALIIISKRVLGTGEKWMASAGYLIRLPVYGAAFYITLKVGGTVAGIASLFGFLTTNFSMIYIYGIKSKFSKGRKVRSEVLAEFEREDRERELRKEGIIEED